MVGVAVVDEPSAAVSLLDPLRARVLAALREPGSATTVAAVLGETRQRVNYHLRALEDQGLVRFVEERPRRGLTERIVQSTASGYVIAPEVVGPCAASADRTDRLSADHLVAVAARTVDEVARLTRQAQTAGQRLATLSIDTEIRFASAADRAAFTEDLAQAVTDLAARYHDESAPGGRRHRLVIAAHPRPGGSETADPDPARPVHTPLEDDDHA